MASAARLRNFSPLPAPTVHGIARSVENLESLQASILEDGGKCFTHACDVSDLDNLHNVMAEVLSESKVIDILINNAGIYATAAVRNMELSQWSSTMNINCSAAFVATRAVLEQMIHRKSGRIVFISSISGKSAERMALHILPQNSLCWD